MFILSLFLADTVGTLQNRILVVSTYETEIQAFEDAGCVSS